jgi:hypothetical protein
MSADNGFVICPRCRCDLAVKCSLFNVLANKQAAEMIRDNKLSISVSFGRLLDAVEIRNICCRTAALGAIKRVT